MIKGNFYPVNESIIFTDGWRGYDGLVLDGCKHYRVHHSANEFARGHRHIQWHRVVLELRQNPFCKTARHPLQGLDLLTKFIQSGLGMQERASKPMSRRMLPPVAIRRISWQSPRPVLSKRELYAIIDAEDINTTRGVSPSDNSNALRIFSM